MCTLVRSVWNRLIILAHRHEYGHTPVCWIILAHMSTGVWLELLEASCMRVYAMFIGLWID